MTHKFDFEYEIEALGQCVTVTVSVTSSSFPGDPGPDGEDEVEIESVTLNGFDMDTDGIKVVRMRPLFMPLEKTGITTKLVPEWFLLTNLIREDAWERAREAA